MKSDIGKWRKCYIPLVISVFIFLICRYIGNIINLFYTLFNTDLNYIASVKLDRIYDYRYNLPLIFLIIFLSFSFVSKNFYDIKKFILKLLRNTKRILVIGHNTERVIIELFNGIRRITRKFLNSLYGWQLPLLLGVLGFCIINNYIILKHDTRPLVMNSAYYFTKSLTYYSLLENLTISNILPAIKLALYVTPIPPLFMLTPSPFYYFFGKSPDIAILTHSLYLTILVFSVYGIGKYFYNKKVGVLAAFITITMPGIIALSRTYRPDIPLTAMTALSVYTLLLSNSFKNKKYSILFGIVAGLSFLTKMSNLIFFLIIIGVYSLFKLRIHKIKIKNLLLAIILLLIIALPWHMVHKDSLVIETYKRITNISPNGMSKENLQDNSPDNYSIKQSSWVDYGFVFPAKFSISYFYTFLFFLAAASLFFYKKRNNDFLLIGWIIIPYIFWFVAIFGIMSNDPRLHNVHNYTLPCLPAIALFISSLIFKLKIKEHTKWIIISVIIGGGIFQYIGLSYSIGTNMQFPEISGGTDYGMYSAKQEDWKLDEIINSIKIREEDKNPIVLFASISPTISPTLSIETLDYTARLHKKRLDLREPVGCIYLGACGNVKKNVLEADYVITFEVERGLLRTDSTFLTKQTELIQTFNENINKFKLNKEFRLPDNSILSVYERL